VKNIVTIEGPLMVHEKAWPPTTERFAVEFS